MTEKQMLLEVAAYVEAFEKADARWSETNHELDRMYSDRYDMYVEADEVRVRAKWQMEAYNLQWLHYRDAYDDAVERATNMLRESSDPFVRWIMDNVWEDYEDEALLVLRILPASMSELRDLAEQQNWCNRFDRFMSRARQAGVLPEEAPMLPAHEDLHDWLSDQLGMRRFREVRVLVDAALREAEAAARDELRTRLLRAGLVDAAELVSREGAAASD